MNPVVLVLIVLLNWLEVRMYVILLGLLINVRLLVVLVNISSIATIWVLLNLLIIVRQYVIILIWLRNRLLLVNIQVTKILFKHLSF